MTDAKDGDDGHGCSAELDGGVTSVVAMAAPTKARMSINELRCTYCTLYRGTRWSELAGPR